MELLWKFFVSAVKKSTDEHDIDFQRHDYSSPGRSQPHITTMMDTYDSNGFVEDSNQHPEKEPPPFAVDNDNFSSPGEQRHGTLPENTGDSSIPETTQTPTKSLHMDDKQVKFAEAGYKTDHPGLSSDSQYSSHSTPPDLAESTVTDETSSSSIFSSPRSEASLPINHDLNMSSSPSFIRHSSGMSSILSTSSMKSVALEQSFRTVSGSLHGPTPQHGGNSRSIGFSELMNAADDSNVNLDVSGTSNHISNHRSIGRLPPLPENQEAECGTLISAAPEYSPRDRIPHKSRRQKKQSWWQNVPFMEAESRSGNSELNSPLLTRTGSYGDDSTFEPLNVTRLFSNGSHQHQSMILALERAHASIETNIESDDSFEVSLLLGQNTRCSVDDVVEVISNVDLLSLWCNPIDSLIVTSSSSEGSPFLRASEEMRRSDQNENSERTREYEAEWIEATTSSLESPSSSAGFILTAGQTVLQSLGCTSYGKISMFIERQHGRISLNVGPFNGGISASHSISVSLEEHSGKIRIVDRVKLTHENEEDTFLLGKVLGCATGSCLGSCFLPPIDGYVDQVTMSMSRLQLLLENSVNVRSVSRSG